MAKSEKVRTHYSEEFKLSALKDMYENGLSINSTAKKYGISSRATIKNWEMQYPIESKMLSLPDEVITKVQTMRKAKALTASDGLPREEQLQQEVANLRKALAYSELRNEALHEVLKIGKEQYGVDLLKKVGAKQ